MRELRIGVDARYAFRRERRGIGQYLAHLLTHLAAEAPAAMRFILYLDGKGEASLLDLPDDRFRIRTLTVTNPLTFEEVALPWAARRDHLDLLHLPANYGPTLAPCPTLYTVHDVIEFRRRTAGPWQDDLRHRLGRFVRTHTLPGQLARARLVLTPSEAAKRDIRAVLGVRGEKIRVVPHGVEGIAPHPNPRGLRKELRTRGFPVPERYILAFAALDPRKNGEILWRAWKDVQILLPDVELWLVGVEDPARYGIPEFLPRLRLLSYLPRRDVVELLQGASLFVYPSRYEGFGLPVLEAMAAGVPVIASNATSIPEVAGDAALLFPPDALRQLEDHVLDVLKHEEVAARLREQGLRRAERFRWERSARAHIDAYQEAAGFRPSSE